VGGGSVSTVSVLCVEVVKSVLTLLCVYQWVEGRFQQSLCSMLK